MHSLLIVGCGSIGERHVRCFLRTNRARVAACDTDPEALARVSQKYGVPAFRMVMDALHDGAFTGMVVATPAHTHLAIAREGARQALAVLIEMPLSASLDGVEQTQTSLLQAERFAAVGYVYRCMPWVREARDFFRHGDIGRPLHATVCAGQHFPTFRPGYESQYYARHEEGGGAIQEALTHLANVVEWFVGPVTALFADSAHQALRGVTVEDTVNVSARHGGVLVSYALNQFQAANETRIQLHGERGSLAIEPHRRRWGYLLHGERAWAWYESPPMERDDLFVAQAHAFLDGCEGRATPLCSFDEAVQTLKFNRAALESAPRGFASFADVTH